MAKKIRKKKRARFSRIDLDATFYSDILTGNGFIISEPAEVTINGQRKKSLYGARSPLYGTDYSDEQAFIERYRCECIGDDGLKGKQFEGYICPKCGQPVRERGDDINKTGWISFGVNEENNKEPNRIINPYYYNILSSTLGKKDGRSIFTDIIYPKYKVTINGNREKPTDEDFETTPTSPYYGIGIDEFYNQYEEIIFYFKSLKKGKNKDKVFDNLILEKNKVFTSHFPIMSTKLRPQSITSTSYHFVTMDKVVNTLFSLSENLKVCNDIERDYILQRIQTKVNTIWNLALDILNTKDGHIRGEMLGGSLIIIW